MTVATLALLAHPASALGETSDPLGDGVHLVSPPIVTHHLGTLVKLDDGTIICVILPPTKVGDGTVTVGTKITDDVDDVLVIYKNPNGSITIDVNTDSGTVSYTYHYDNGTYYIDGGGNTAGGDEVHAGIHITDRIKVGVVHIDQINGGHKDSQNRLEGSYSF